MEVNLMQTLSTTQNLLLKKGGLIHGFYSMARGTVKNMTWILIAVLRKMITGIQSLEQGTWKFLILYIKRN